MQIFYVHTGTPNPYVEKFMKKIGGQILDFYTMELDELLVIAKYRILPTDTVLVVKGNKQVCRLVDDIDLSIVAKAIVP
jgi:hypothetical protein